MAQEGEATSGANDDNGDDDNDSAVESIIAEALACGDSVQICRTPKRRSSGSENNGVNQAKLALMSLFGQTEESNCCENGIIAEPATLQSMRRAARDHRVAAAKIHRSSDNGRTRKNLRRSHTVGDPVADLPYNRRVTMKNRIATPTGTPAASTFPAILTDSAENKERNRESRRPLMRSKTSQTPPRGPRSLSPAEIHRQASTMSHYYMMDNTTDTSHHHNYDMGEHEETVQRLKIHDDDIQQLLQDPKAFATLQKVLRKHGAITNEVLRQVLPLYLKHQHAEMEKKASRQNRKQQRQEEEDVKTSSGEPTGTATDSSTPTTTGWRRISSAAESNNNKPS